LNDTACENGSGIGPLNSAQPGEKPPSDRHDLRGHQQHAAADDRQEPAEVVICCSLSTPCADPTRTLEGRLDEGRCGEVFGELKKPEGGARWRLPRHVQKRRPKAGASRAVSSPFGRVAARRSARGRGGRQPSDTRLFAVLKRWPAFPFPVKAGSTQAADHPPDRRKVLVGVELSGIDHRLHRAPMDPAHRHGCEAFRGLTRERGRVRQ